MRKIFYGSIIVFLTLLAIGMRPSDSFASNNHRDTSTVKKNNLDYGTGLFSFLFYLDDKRITTKQAEALFYQNPQSKYYYRYAKSNNIISSVMGGVSGLFIGAGFMNIMAGHSHYAFNPVGLISVGLGIGILIPAVVMYSGSQKNLKKAIDIYNIYGSAPAVSHRSDFELRLFSSGNGIGLAFNF